MLKLFGTRTFYQLDDGGASIRAFADDPGAPELVVIDDELTDDDVVRLYRSCDALAFPYRGEGFGLPMLEALACGLPVIATAGGAADAFLDDDVAYRIPARRVPLTGVMRGEELAGEGWWLEPDADSARRDHARGRGAAGRGAHESASGLRARAARLDLGTRGVGRRRTTARPRESLMPVGGPPRRLRAAREKQVRTPFWNGCRQDDRAAQRSAHSGTAHRLRTAARRVARAAP